MLTSCRLTRHSTLALFTLLLALLWTAAPVFAQPGTNSAALVIAHPDGTVTYAIVQFEELEINGIELLKRSGIELVTIEFGGLGEGVCSISRDGCPVPDCRQRLCQTGDPDSPYWRYFGQSQGEWQVMPIGGSGARVTNGEVNAWAWTAEDPDLPALTFNDIGEHAGIDASKKSIAAGVAMRRLDAAGNLVSEPTLEGKQSVLAGATIVVVLVLVAGTLVWWKRRAAR